MGIFLSADTKEKDDHNKGAIRSLRSRRARHCFGFSNKFLSRYEEFDKAPILFSSFSSVQLVAFLQWKNTLCGSRKFVTRNFKKIAAQHTRYWMYNPSLQIATSRLTSHFAEFKHDRRIYRECESLHIRLCQYLFPNFKHEDIAFFPGVLVTIEPTHQVPHLDFPLDNISPSELPWIVHSPLTYEGMEINIWRPKMDKKLVGHHCHIPIGNMIMLRADVIHGGCYGSPGNARFHMVLMPKKHVTELYTDDAIVKEKLKWEFEEDYTEVQNKGVRFPIDHDKLLLRSYLHHSNGALRHEDFLLLPEKPPEHSEDAF